MPEDKHLQPSSLYTAKFSLKYEGRLKNTCTIIRVQKFCEILTDGLKHILKNIQIKVKTNLAVFTQELYEIRVIKYIFKIFYCILK